MLSEAKMARNNVIMSRRLAKIAAILREKLGDRYTDFVVKWTTSGTAFVDMPTGVQQVITDAESEYARRNS